MKKRLLICILMASILLLAACSYGAGSGGSGTPASAEVESIQGAVEKETEATNSTEDLVREFNATIKEAVLFDDKDVKITAKELTYSASSAELQLLLENNTQKNLSFCAGSIGYSVNSVNGYMISDGYVLEDIAAGMNANVSMTFSLDELIALGISNVADIGLGFEIKDGYDDYLVTGPMEVKTNIADSYDYSKDTFAEAMSGTALAKAVGYTINYSASDKLFDEKGISILNDYVITNKDGQQSLLMEVQNQSDEDLYAAESDVCINGMSVSSGVWDSVYLAAGKRAVMSLAFDSLIGKNYLELLGMNEYGSCGMNFEVKDKNGKDLASKPIEINFGGKADPASYKGDVLYDKNGFQFMAVGLAEDSFDLSDDLHVLILMKNGSDKPVYVSKGFNDVYVNKTKISEISVGRSVQPGGYGLIDLELTGSDLKDNSLDKSNITEVSTKFEISDGNFTNYDEMDITMTLKP